MTHFGPLPDSKNPKKDFLYFILFVLVLFLVAYYQYYRRSRALEKHEQTYAVVTDMRRQSRGGNDIYVEYKRKNKIIAAERIHNSECYGELRIGDSVLNKYSIEFPEIVDLVYCSTNGRNPEDEWWK